MSRGLDIDDRDVPAVVEAGLQTRLPPEAEGAVVAAELQTRLPPSDRLAPVVAAGLQTRRPSDPRASLDAALSRGLDETRVLPWRGREITLSRSEGATLRTLGTFRTVAVSDLATHRYNGDRARCLRELRQLERPYWTQTLTLPGRRGGRATPVVTLTREGHAFARQHLASGGQRLHWGLVRPREQEHDAAIYRMAVAESERLSKSGATVTRVVLDAELKGQLAAERNRPGADDPEVRTRTAAQALHLQIVDGRVQIPDLRLEYETREGDVGRVDLELATEHYRPGQVAAKAQAGFTIYAAATQTGRLAAALQDRGLVATILSL